MTEGNFFNLFYFIFDSACAPADHLCAPLVVKKIHTYSLLVWVNISDAKVVFLQQVKMVADEVKQVLSFGVPLKET